MSCQGGRFEITRRPLAAVKSFLAPPQFRAAGGVVPRFAHHRPGPGGDQPELRRHPPDRALREPDQLLPASAGAARIAMFPSWDGTSPRGGVRPARSSTGLEPLHELEQKPVRCLHDQSGLELGGGKRQARPRSGRAGRGGWVERTGSRWGDGCVGRWLGSGGHVTGS